jgi:hypothetical protein
MTRNRGWLIGAVTILIAAPASANGAMGMALATFEWPLWLTYVGVTLLLEALILGIYWRVPPLRAVAMSVLANAATAFLGGYCLWYAALIPLTAVELLVRTGPGLQDSVGKVFGTGANPNPIGQIVLFFTVSALLSAWIEGRIWWAANRQIFEEKSFGAVLRASIAVHMVTLPVGLAILLSPERPYPGLEARTASARQSILWRPIADATMTYVKTDRRLPNAGSAEEFVRALASQPALESNSDAWVAAYEPDFRRFDTGEFRRHSLEWNDKAKVPSDGSADTVWLIRRVENSWAYGLVIDANGEARWSRRSEELGLPLRHRVR